MFGCLNLFCESIVFLFIANTLKLTEPYFVFQDNENDIFKRDFSSATLEDHFDKTILPKVMQVCYLFSE